MRSLGVVGGGRAGSDSRASTESRRFPCLSRATMMLSSRSPKLLLKSLQGMPIMTLVNLPFYHSIQHPKNVSHWYCSSYGKAHSKFGHQRVYSRVVCLTSSSESVIWLSVTSLADMSYHYVYVKHSTGPSTTSSSRISHQAHLSGFWITPSSDIFGCHDVTCLLLHPFDADPIV